MSNYIYVNLHPIFIFFCHSIDIFTPYYQKRYKYRINYHIFNKNYFLLSGIIIDVYGSTWYDK